MTYNINNYDFAITGEFFALGSSNAGTMMSQIGAFVSVNADNPAKIARNIPLGTIVELKTTTRTPSKVIINHIIAMPDKVILEWSLVTPGCIGSPFLMKK